MKMKLTFLFGITLAAMICFATPAFAGNNEGGPVEICDNSEQPIWVFYNDDNKNEAKRVNPTHPISCETIILHSKESQGIIVPDQASSFICQFTANKAYEINVATQQCGPPQNAIT